MTSIHTLSAGVNGAGRIEIQLGQARVCIHGVPDPATLALVLLDSAVFKFTNPHFNFAQKPYRQC